jgi:RNA polymerase sigma factor (sigma-70 family)
LAEAIASLPEDEQEALLLRYCEEWTLDAIGNHLEVSRNTIARLLRRGLITLRSKLQELE